MEAAFGPLLGRLDGPLTTRFVDLAADGDKVFLRFESSEETKTGLRYDQVYCFAMVMREQRIVEIVAYLDTELLVKVFSEFPVAHICLTAASGSQLRYTDDDIDEPERPN